MLHLKKILAGFNNNNNNVFAYHSTPKSLKGNLDGLRAFFYKISLGSLVYSTQYFVFENTMSNSRAAKSFEENFLSDAQYEIQTLVNLKLGFI